jgi:transcription antitermination factor NusG
MADQRDETTWATLELTKLGEQKAIEGKLEASLRSLLSVDSSFPIFVPYATYTKGGRTVSVRLIEGYAFIATGLPETSYFRLERSQLVSRVFSSQQRNGMRVLHSLPNGEVESMRERLADSLGADLEVGAKVRITGGNYRDLEGVVMDLYEKRAAVQVVFRSLTAIAVVPRNLVTFSSPEVFQTSDSESEITVSLEELLEGGSQL